MAEVEIPGKAVVIDYECPECPDGVMRPTGISWSGTWGSPNCPHECEECGHQKILDRRYPATEIRRADKVTMD